jgi:hypothetical protein
MARRMQSTAPAKKAGSWIGEESEKGKNANSARGRAMPAVRRIAMRNSAGLIELRERYIREYRS